MARNTHLDQLLDTLLEGKRHGRPNKATTKEDWAAATLPVTVVRAFQTTKLNEPAKNIPLGDGLTLMKPEGFQGEITVTTWGQATRGVEGDPGLKPPPGLESFPELFQPIRRSGTRSIGPSGIVIAFDIDETSRKSITPDNPLRLELPAEPAEQVTDLLPVAFDGEDYIPVGYAAEGSNIVDVVNLPRPVTPTDAEGLPTKRGIGRTIRLFVYKKMGHHTTLTGLHRAEIVDGEVIYSDVKRDQFKPGDTVALFVHGFISDTGWMIKGPAQFLRQEVLAYKHFLTWDYETFGTTVQENGENLALALKQQCGFSADDGITVHVYAHSMGCLVSRCMLELSGGSDFIDRLVMAGPPNNGTTLATLSRGAVYIVSALLNRASVLPLLSPVNWILKQVYEQGTGWADLKVNSPIVHKLNSLPQPTNVPYLVLVGNNTVDEAEKSRLKRLALKVLDRSFDSIFGEQNDIVIGVSSMRSLRGGAYPLLKQEEVPCDHFHYYLIPEGQKAIKKWMLT